MTAPNGPILFNSGGGSDTEASGLGPIPAVFGSGASTTSASAVVTGIDTTGVTAGDLLWVSTSSGRKFSVIASVDSGTQVTCDDTFGVTAGSQTWAIGGKRATWDSASSRLLFTADMKTNWIIETETDQSLSSVIATANAAPIVRGSSGAIRVVTQSANAACFDLNANTGAIGTAFSNLKFQNTNGTKTSAHGVLFRAAGPTYFRKCTLGDATNTLNNGIRRNQGIGSAVCDFCSFESCTVGIELQSNGSFQIGNCRFSACGNGISLGSATVAQFAMIGCVFDSCTTDGLVGTGTQPIAMICIGNIFYGNGGDGISLTNATLVGLLSGNVFSENGGYGMDYNGTTSAANNLRPDFNAFYSNTAGTQTNIIAGDNDITLSADPFVDAAAGDFNINNTSGGGALLRAATVVLP